jgi:hypothetical protein
MYLQLYILTRFYFILFFLFIHIIFIISFILLFLDPEQSCTAVSPEMTLPQSLDLTHTRRSKSAYWSGVPDAAVTSVPDVTKVRQPQPPAARERVQVVSPDVHHLPTQEESVVGTIAGMAATFCMCIFLTIYLHNIRMSCSNYCS